MSRKPSQSALAEVERLVAELAAILGNCEEVEAIRFAVSKLRVGRPKGKRHKVSPHMLACIERWDGKDPNHSRFAKMLGISRQYLYELRAKPKEGG